MKAFHNDPKVKAKYVARVRAHQEADRLIRGTARSAAHDFYADELLKLLKKARK